MRTIPEIDALRILASGQQRRACSAEMEVLAERHRQLSVRRDEAQGKIREIMQRHGLDPDACAVVTAEDAAWPLGTVVSTQTNQPIPDKPVSPESLASHEPKAKEYMPTSLPFSPPDGHVGESC